jgi:hypothetical protein
LYPERYKEKEGLTDTQLLEYQIHLGTLEATMMWPFADVLQSIAWIPSDRPFNVTLIPAPSRGSSTSCTKDLLLTRIPLMFAETSPRYRNGLVNEPFPKRSMTDVLLIIHRKGRSSIRE